MPRPPKPVREQQKAQQSASYAGQIVDDENVSGVTQQIDVCITFIGNIAISLLANVFSSQAMHIDTPTTITSKRVSPVFSSFFSSTSLPVLGTPAFSSGDCQCKPDHTCVSTSSLVPDLSLGMGTFEGIHSVHRLPDQFRVCSSLRTTLAPFGARFPVAGDYLVFQSRRQ
jgi:hypothetical protein